MLLRALTSAVVRLMVAWGGALLRDVFGGGVCVGGGGGVRVLGFRVRVSGGGEEGSA
jgi:hypothetical protein